jgi:hypothetical protein
MPNSIFLILKIKKFKMKITNKKFKILFSIILFSIITTGFISTYNNTYAQANNDIMADIANENIMFGEEVGLEYKDPQQATIDIINIVLGFVGLIFLIMVIISGIQWMISGGNEEKVASAKKRLINSTIGVAIILCAYIIANGIMMIIQGETSNNWLW